MSFDKQAVTVKVLLLLLINIQCSVMQTTIWTQMDRLDRPCQRKRLFLTLRRYSEQQKRDSTVLAELEIRK